MSKKNVLTIVFIIVMLIMIISLFPSPLHNTPERSIKNLTWQYGDVYRIIECEFGIESPYVVIDNDCYGFKYSDEQLKMFKFDNEYNYCDIDTPIDDEFNVIKQKRFLIEKYKYDSEHYIFIMKNSSSLRLFVPCSLLDFSKPPEKFSDPNQIHLTGDDDSLYKIYFK